MEQTCQNMNIVGSRLDGMVKRLAGIFMPKQCNENECAIANKKNPAASIVAILGIVNIELKLIDFHPYIFIPFYFFFVVFCSIHLCPAH